MRKNNGIPRVVDLLDVDMNKVVDIIIMEEHCQLFKTFITHLDFVCSFYLYNFNFKCQAENNPDDAEAELSLDMKVNITRLKVYFFLQGASSMISQPCDLYISVTTKVARGGTYALWSLCRSKQNR